MGFPNRHSSRRTSAAPANSAARGPFAPLPSYIDGSLIDPRFDSDSCGVGFVAQLSAVPSRQILDHALGALSRLEHRGAVAADGKSSDGVGVTTAIPREWLLSQCSLSLDESTPLGVAVLFLPKDDTAQRAEIEAALFEQDMEVLTWRPVPIRPEVLGERSLPPRVPKSGTCSSPPTTMNSSIVASSSPASSSSAPAFPATSPVSRPPPSSIRRFVPDACCRSFIPTSPTPHSKPHSRFFISATLPTFFPRGSERSPSAPSPTTAKSTPSGATARAWKPVPPRCPSMCIPC
jgi:hypothetical protein